MEKGYATGLQPPDVFVAGSNRPLKLVIYQVFLLFSVLILR
jgi:hypothetical protein